MGSTVFYCSRDLDKDLGITGGGEGKEKGGEERRNKRRGKKRRIKIRREKVVR